MSRRHFESVHTVKPDQFRCSPNLTLLDCSCGIGTQAIGLAKRGFTVTATDLSSVAIQRAKRESQSFGVEIDFGVADFRSLETDVTGKFDIVLSADNALPHLISDDDLYLAEQRRSCT